MNCEVCGQRVRLKSGVEGTNSYIPVDSEERDDFKRKMEHEHIVAELAIKERDKLKQDMSLAVSNAGKDLIAEGDRYKAALTLLRAAPADRLEYLNSIGALIGREYGAVTCEDAHWRDLIIDEAQAPAQDAQSGEGEKGV